MEITNKEFREEFRRKIPKLYNGYIHLLFNITCLLAGIIVSTYQINSLKASELFVIPLVLILGNLVVFIVHKYPLHKYMKPFSMAYKIHAKSHHVFYTHENIIFEGSKDFYILFFPTWVVLGFILTYFPIVYILGLYFLPHNVTMLFLCMGCVYFLLYEFVHFASHLKEDNPLLKIPGLKFMWNHHRVHHNPKLMASYNFNIVFPLFDKLFGTTYKDNK